MVGLMGGERPVEAHDVGMDTVPLVLVDGSYYLHRAYHALPPMTTGAGFPTHAIRGLVSMLMSLQDQYPDSPVVVVMDAPGKTFRSERYPQYKAHRPKMPDELRVQIDKAEAVVRAMGFPYLSEKGVESDDVIGTLALRSVECGRPVVISSGDKDLMQLVGESIMVLDTMRNKKFDREAVHEKYGVYPERIVDYLALCGDTSDNIPGVAGVGPKTAAELLTRFGSMEDIYADLEQVRASPLRGASSVASKLEKHKEDAELSHWLATIDTGLAFEFDVSDLKLATISDELYELFSELEFSALTKRVRAHADSRHQPGPGKAQRDDAAADWQALTVLDEKDLEEWVERLRNADYFALDTETTSLNYMDARLVGISVATDANRGVYIPIGHDYQGAPRQLAADLVLKRLRPIFEDERCAKIGHNLKYDRAVLANHGIVLRGVVRDTMLASYALHASRRRRDLAGLLNYHFGDNPLHYEDVAGKGAKQIPFNQVELSKATPYAVADACGAWKLDRELGKQLRSQKKLNAIFEDIDMPLLTVLSDMERCGVLIDSDLLKKHSQDWSTELADLRGRACEMVGTDFNLDSPKQLRELLYEKLGLPVLGTTTHGQASTAEPVLQRLVNKHPLPGLLLQYRELAKLKSTYADRLPESVSPDTGRVHSSWHQAAVATGRLSSSDPNLQNIPIRSENGRQIRRAFIAPPGHLLLAADYSQIELRVMAHISGDETMCQAFADDRDIHSATAAEIFDVGVDQVDEKRRRSAKAINFGLIYGMSAFGLARQLDIPRKEAEDYISRYFDRYPGVRRYMDEICQSARERGYVETLSGRRLDIYALDSKNPQERRGAERVAINAPIQGTAADIIKQAMLKTHALFPVKTPPARMIMQVHDELVMEVREDAAQEVGAQLRELMEQAMSLVVPLKVDIGAGRNWDEAHP